MKVQVKLSDLAQFLIDANTNTYADKDAPKAISSRMESRDYHFEKGDLIYHDTYFGGRDFIGSEIVYKSEIPIWGMNYYGYVLDPTANVPKIYTCLRAALMAKYDDIIPVRGPKHFEYEDWKYLNIPTGDLQRFAGEENIIHCGNTVYQAEYHGGFIE